MEFETRQTLDGGCLCGAVRYRVTYPFKGKIGHCHCTMCRRASGAPVVTWFTVRKDDFEIMLGSCRIYASSDHGERGSCPTCGSQLTFFSRKNPIDIDVTLCTLDNPQHFPPAMHLSTDTRLPWLRIDEHLPTRSTNG